MPHYKFKNIYFVKYCLLTTVLLVSVRICEHQERALI